MRDFLLCLVVCLVACGGEEPAVVDSEPESVDPLEVIRQARLLRAGCEATATDPDDPEYERTDVYDEHGWETSSVYRDGNTIITSYEREQERVVRAVVEYRFDGNTTTNTLTYDEHEHLVETVYSDDPSDPTTRVLEHDESGRLTRATSNPTDDMVSVQRFDGCENEVIWELDGQVVGETLVSYHDIDACVVARMQYDARSGIQSVSSFDEGGRLTSLRFYESDGSLDFARDYAWSCP